MWYPNLFATTLTLLTATSQARHDVLSSTTHPCPQIKSGPVRRQLNDSHIVPLYGESAQPVLSDIFPCTDTGHIEAPVAALLTTRPDILQSLQTMDNNGVVVTRVTNPTGELKEFSYDSTQLTAHPVSWFAAFVDAFNQLDQNYPLPDDGKPSLGSRAARNVNALLWDQGYATYCDTWWNDAGKVNYFGRASDENRMLLVYTNDNQVRPVSPWTSFGYAPFSSIRDMSHPDQPIWPPSVNIDATRYGNDVLSFGDVNSYVGENWELADFKKNVAGVICSD